MKTNLQKFRDLFDEMGIEYEVVVHAGDIKELQIYHKHLYHDFRDNKVKNAVSIAFNSNDEFMYFDGMSI